MLGIRAKQRFCVRSYARTKTARESAAKMPGAWQCRFCSQLRRLHRHCTIVHWTPPRRGAFSTREGCNRGLHLLMRASAKVAKREKVSLNNNRNGRTFNGNAVGQSRVDGDGCARSRRLDRCGRANCPHAGVRSRAAGRQAARRSEDRARESRRRLQRSGRRRLGLRRLGTHLRRRARRQASRSSRTARSPRSRSST